MRIPLDPDSPNPLYRQIAAHLRDSILSGNLPAGTRLPATRALAADLGLNRLTVENAYSVLEADGLIAAQVGSGTYVLPLVVPAEKSGVPVAPEADPGLPLEELSLGPAQPGLINFAAGTCDPRLFPVDDFRKTVQAVMRRDGTAALEYGDMRGYTPLRRTIAQVLASQGLRVAAEHLLVTSGSQQALALVAQTLLAPGDTVVVESPSYAWGLDLFRACGLRMVSVPTDEQGMQVDRLEEILRLEKPGLIYTIPNFQNPSGICMSGARRRRLVALAAQVGVPVLEDDYVGDLRYDGHAQPALKALDPGGGVIYVGTFSKMLMPGLRVGYLAADGALYDRLVERKRLSDVASSNLVQRALEAYVTVGRYQAHLRRSVQVYRRRRDRMVRALKDAWPAPVRIPQGGLFFWLELPPGCSADDLLPIAAGKGLSFMPGGRYFVDPARGARWLRLNFAASQPGEIERGIGLLVEALKELSG
jgi:GntR family transcriptional regulator/MocR family aminotransferase